MADNITQTLRDVTRFRGLLMIVVVLGLVFLRPPAMQPIPLAAVAILFTLYLLVLHFVVFPRIVSAALILGMVLIDIVFISVALYFTGGVESILFTLYPISIMYSAVSLGYLGGFVAATAVTLAYGILLVLTGTPTSISGFLPLQMPFFYLLALLSGYVVQMETSQRQQAKTLREMLQLERGAKEILKVTRELNSTLERDEILPRVAAVAAQVTGLSRCLFVLLDERASSVAGESSNVPLPGSGLDRVRDIIAGLEPSGPVRMALESGNPVLVEEAVEDNRLPEPGLFERLGIRSFMLLPLVHRDAFLGIMYLDDGGKPHAFRPEEVRLAQTFGDQAATAIANAQRYSDAQERIQDLVAEIRSVAQLKESAAKSTRAPELNFDEMEIDSQLRRVTVRGRQMNLSWTEFELLQFLASNPGTAFSRETIFRKVWKQEYYISTNLVDVCVHRLRQKVEKNPAEPRYVVTVHGVGYMFARPQPGAAE